jgi:hypothetical protein
MTDPKLTAKRVRGPNYRYFGLQVVFEAPRHPVEETRRLKMPDGTVLICRRRVRSERPRKSYWTAEVPIEVAMEVFGD